MRLRVVRRPIYRQLGNLFIDRLRSDRVGEAPFYKEKRARQTEKERDKQNYAFGGGVEFDGFNGHKLDL